MLVVAEYVPVVRWFRENEKNKGAGFKIKPESLTWLKDRVQKEIAFLGTKGTISPFKCKAPEVYLYLLHDLFPRFSFLQALPSGKHTLFLSWSPISCRSASLGMNITASFLDFIVTTQKQNTPMHINKTPPKTKWGWSREGKKFFSFPKLPLSFFFSIKRIYCSSLIAYARVSDLHLFFSTACLFYYSHF